MPVKRTPQLQGATSPTEESSRARVWQPMQHSLHFHVPSSQWTAPEQAAQRTKAKANHGVKYPECQSHSHPLSSLFRSKGPGRWVHRIAPPAAAPSSQLSGSDGTAAAQQGPAAARHVRPRWPCLRCWGPGGQAGMGMAWSDGCTRGAAQAMQPVCMGAVKQMDRQQAVGQAEQQVGSAGTVCTEKRWAHNFPAAGSSTICKAAFRRPCQLQPWPSPRTRAKQLRPLGRPSSTHQRFRSRPCLWAPAG